MLLKDRELATHSTAGLYNGDYTSLLDKRNILPLQEQTF